MLGLQPNSQLNNNLIHDVEVNAGKAGSNGMFLDEGITDVVVANNSIFILKGLFICVVVLFFVHFCCDLLDGNQFNVHNQRHKEIRYG